MGLGESDPVDDGDGGGSALSLGSCSICLEVVTDDGDRSFAKLICGHRFHLDCIGSAFNAKGAMQCPNCRKVEKGQWLYSSAGRPFPEFNIDEAHDEDLYDLAELSFGVHWCPYSGMQQLPANFDEGEFATTSYHNLVGHHAVLGEHMITQATTHPCPYLPYLGSSSSGNLDGSSYNNNWNGPTMHGDIPYAYPGMDVHQHRWDHHSSVPTSISRAGFADSFIPQRAVGPSSDIPMSGSFMSPFVVGASSNARVASSITSSMVPPHPGSVARSRHRVQALQAYFQQPTNNTPPSRPVVSSSRRPSNHRSMAQITRVPSASDQNDLMYYAPPPLGPDAEDFMLNHSRPRERRNSFPLSDRESSWGMFPHEAGAGSDPTTIRSTSFVPRHGSERAAPFQSQHHRS